MIQAKGEVTKLVAGGVRSTPSSSNLINRLERLRNRELQEVVMDGLLQKHVEVRGAVANFQLESN